MRLTGFVSLGVTAKHRNCSQFREPWFVPDLPSESVLEEGFDQHGSPELVNFSRLCCQDLKRIKYNQRSLHVVEFQKGLCCKPNFSCSRNKRETVFACDHRQILEKHPDCDDVSLQFSPKFTRWSHHSICTHQEILQEAAQEGNLSELLFEKPSNPSTPISGLISSSVLQRVQSLTDSYRKSFEGCFLGIFKKRNLSIDGHEKCLQHAICEQPSSEFAIESFLPSSKEPHLSNDNEKFVFQHLNEEQSFDFSGNHQHVSSCALLDFDKHCDIEISNNEVLSDKYQHVVCDSFPLCSATESESETSTEVLAACGDVAANPVVEVAVLKNNPKILKSTFENPSEVSNRDDSHESFERVLIGDNHESVEISKQSLSKSKISGLLSQTLQDLEMGEFWLVDSGASRSVISSRLIEQYHIVRERVLDNPLTFSTASGEHMQIDREVQVRCQLEVHRNNRIVRQVVVLRVLVADVQHNLLSTSQMTRMGWSVHFNPNETTIELNGSTIHPMMWAGVPWVKVSHPKVQKQSNLLNLGSFQKQ